MNLSNHMVDLSLGQDTEFLRHDLEYILHAFSTNLFLSDHVLCRTQTQGPKYAHTGGDDANEDLSLHKAEQIPATPPRHRLPVNFSN